MKITHTKGFKEEVLSNKFLVDMTKKYMEACDNGTHKEFLDANPDYVQVMMNFAMDDRIVIDETDS